MKRNDTFSALVGQTPLINAKAFSKALGITGEIFAKLEAANPTGSAKDRAALYMINDAEDRGLLVPGGTVIEPTSGNTGIALAAIAAARGYKAIIVMPETMSRERRAMISAYGAQIVLTDGKGGMQASVERAQALNREIENSIIAGQFSNPANALSHYETTGPEIYEAMDGRVDVLVAGIGTGGTVCGIGRFLKEKSPNTVIIGVEPKSSPLITEGRAGAHGIQGIGANFIPELFDKTVVDEIVTVSDEDAFACGRIFAKSEGVLVGISSGAALAAAAVLAQKKYCGKRIAVILPDSGNRYLSTPLFNNND